VTPEGGAGWFSGKCPRSSYPRFVFAAIGLEPTEPVSFLDVAVKDLHVDMIYSHSGAGVVVAALLVAGIVHGVWRRRFLSAWCAGLVAVHWLCDLVSGFAHEAFVAGSPKIGLDLYATRPELAFIVEAAFAGALVAWFVRHERLAGRPVRSRMQVALVAVFVGGGLSMIPTVSTSLRQLVG